MKWLASLHNRVHKGRVQRLAELFERAIPEGASVIDVGAGSGELAELILKLRPDLKITGIDVLVRPNTAIQVHYFDGSKIPFPDRSFDVAIFADVLHHTLNIEDLLREAGRVATQGVLIKDHIAETGLDHRLLRFMDWVGNARYGVVLPYNYLSRAGWQKAIDGAGLKIQGMETAIKLYPFWYDWLFGGRLQAMIRLVPG